MYSKFRWYLAFLVAGVAALSAQTSPTLRDVQVTTAKTDTALRLVLSASFVHQSFRPSPSLLLVDIAGAAVVSPRPTVHLAEGPVTSYRLYNFTAAGHERVLRLEMTLLNHSKPMISATGNELIVRVQPEGAATTVAATARPSTAVASSRASEHSPAVTSHAGAGSLVLASLRAGDPPRPAPVRLVNVEVERQPALTRITLDGKPGLGSYRGFTLRHPDRYVLDFDNTNVVFDRQRVPVGSSSITAVRISQFSSGIARVVLDLARPGQPRISRVGDKLMLEMANAGAVASIPASAPPPVVRPAVLATVPAERPIVASSISSRAGEPVQPRRITPSPSFAAQANPRPATAPVTAISKPVSVQPAAKAPMHAAELRPAATPVPITEISRTTYSASARSSASIDPPAAPGSSLERPSARRTAPALPTRLAHPASVPAHMPAHAPVLLASASRPPATMADGGRQPDMQPGLQPMTSGIIDSPATPSVAPALQQTAVTPRGVAPRSLLEPLPEGSGTLPVSQYTGERITLNLKNADLKDFFRLIHEVSGLNVVVDPNVQGTVTLVLDDVPWDQALDIVLRNNQLGRQLEGNVLRIATLTTLQGEAKQSSELEKARQEAAPISTEVKQLSYAKATDVAKTLDALKIVGDRGNLTPDPRTNTLIIQTTADVLPTINSLITRLDQKTPQVEVEARVVAASRQFSQDIGVAFGFGTGNGVTSVGGLGAVGVGQTGVTYPNAPPYPIAGASGGAAPSTFPAAGFLPLNVNLPAAAATSGIGLINLTNRYRIDAMLSAAEARGLGHVLSRPKIITQNNTEATVQQGVSIPVQTTINNTISVQFFPVTLKLTVTPQVTAEKTIFLQVAVQNQQIDSGIPRIDGIPAIDTQGATTNVLVTDGGTVVIGGVMVNNNNTTNFEVPLLGSIPVLGNLFKRNTITDSSQELLFFITPRIVQS
jgi:type IV pilus secretin PilQ/predicted competence protein